MQWIRSGQKIQTESLMKEKKVIHFILLQMDSFNVIKTSKVKRNI